MPATLTPTTIFTNAAGTVLAHPAGYGLLRYHGGTWQTPDLAALLSRFGSLLLERSWRYCLVDARNMPTLSVESKQWLEINWLGEKAMRPHPMHMALVQPAEVFSRLAVAQMQALNQSSTRYTYFGDEATAHAWLMQQPL